MREMASLAETDILNPVQAWSEEFGDNPNWSYGWIRKTASNKKLAQPRLGRRYSREVMNAGYSGSLNWIDRPYATVLRLKQFYEQFQGGYFTLINWDGGGRHHVGNFITGPNEVETANGKWTIQGLVFQECAQARMLQYPSDFGCSSHTVYAVDDYLTAAVATYNPFTSLAHPGWHIQQTPLAVATGVSTNAPSSYEMLSISPIAGDYAQVEYVGWGFKLVFRTGAGLGQFGLYLDGSLLLTLDQSTGLQVGSGLPAGVTVAAGIVTALQVPLDKHRVKMVALAVAGAMGGGFSVAYPPLQVIH
jgi:hypothetical protein